MCERVRTNTSTPHEHDRGVQVQATFALELQINRLCTLLFRRQNTSEHKKLVGLRGDHKLHERIGRQSLDDPGKMTCLLYAPLKIENSDSRCLSTSRSTRSARMSERLLGMSLSYQLMNIQEPDAHEFHTRWYKCTLALCSDCRRICGSVDAFDSRAQLSHESTHEQALGSSRKQTAVLTLCRAARNLLLNFGTRANRAAKKPETLPSKGAAARP